MPWTKPTGAPATMPTTVSVTGGKREGGASAAVKGGFLMAISNTFREPRRELTETAIGLLVFGGLLYADYRVSHWLCEGYVPTRPDAVPNYMIVILLMIIVPFLAFIAGLIFIGIHEV